MRMPIIKINYNLNFKIMTTKKEGVLNRKMDVSQAVLARPIVDTVQVFHFKSIEDAKDLMKFLGYPVSLTFEGEIKVKKYVLKENSYILVNPDGSIRKVLSEENFTSMYTIVKPKNN